MSEDKKIAFIVRKSSPKKEDNLLAKEKESETPSEGEKKFTPYEKEHHLEKLGIVITVINDGQASAIVSLFDGVNSATSFITHGEGTAQSDLYDVLGFGEQKKQIIFSTIKRRDWPAVGELLKERFSISRAAKGISFMLDISAVAGISTYKFLTDRRIEPKEAERGIAQMDNAKEYEVIFAVVNNGYTDLVMNAAKRAGARGGTIINARGTGNKDIEKFYGVVISPEKQIVMILVPKEIRDAVLEQITAEVNIHSKGQGIAFSMPVDGVIGITSEENESQEETAE